MVVTVQKGIKNSREVAIYAVSITKEQYNGIINLHKKEKAHKIGFNLTKDDIKIPIVKSNIVWFGDFDNFDYTNFQIQGLFPPPKNVQSPNGDKTIKAYWNYVLEGNRFNNRLPNEEVDKDIKGSYGYWASGIASPDPKTTAHSLFLALKKPKYVLIWYDYIDINKKDE